MQSLIGVLLTLVSLLTIVLTFVVVRRREMQAQNGFDKIETPYAIIRSLFVG